MRADFSSADVSLNQADYRHRLRHSAAHVMADAVLRLHPEAKLAIGPPTEDGFYYDFAISKPFDPDELEKLQLIMQETINKDLPFERSELSRPEAQRLFENQPLKQEILETIPDEETISAYNHGAFIDLCEGPHVESTGKIVAFKLLSVAGAYWRGDEKRQMLQRIYGTAFESQEALEDHLHRLNEAQRRDHRRLARELDLLSFHEEYGPGLVYWHPKGSRTRSIIEDFWRREHYRNGYELVYSPHVGKSALWETSGHLDFYAENMYPPMDLDGQNYYIKPMNCPFHIQIYKTGLKSYRELPIRLAELGTVYRYERSGVLHGLLRVRGFTQDDAHIFCRPDQVQEEIERCVDFMQMFFQSFGFKEFRVYLATRGKAGQYAGSLQDWEMATQVLEDVIRKRGLPYEVDEGGAVFYGPKIDVKLLDALDREWQCTTIQFDFNLPERFDVNYIGADGREHRPYMVHRALLGSIERFFGVLIEHYAGAFPIWLAPVQTMVVPIADRHIDYAQFVVTELQKMNIRAKLDSSKERMNAKVRNAQIQKIPYTLVVGDSEAQNGTVSARKRAGENLGEMTQQKFQDLILAQMAEGL